MKKMVQNKQVLVLAVWYSDVQLSLDMSKQSNSSPSRFSHSSWPSRQADVIRCLTRPTHIYWATNICSKFPPSNFPALIGDRSQDRVDVNSLKYCYSRRITLILKESLSQEVNHSTKAFWKGGFWQPSFRFQIWFVVLLMPSHKWSLKSATTFVKIVSIVCTYSIELQRLSALFTKLTLSYCTP